MMDILELIGRGYLALCGAGVIVVLAAATWINLTRPRIVPPHCALCLTPADDIPVKAGETWHCTPCAFALVEAHAIYHRGEPTP